MRNKVDWSKWARFVGTSNPTKNRDILDLRKFKISSSLDTKWHKKRITGE